MSRKRNLGIFIDASGKKTHSAQIKELKDLAFANAAADKKKDIGLSISEHELAGLLEKANFVLVFLGESDDVDTAKLERICKQSIAAGVAFLPCCDDQFTPLKYSSFLDERQFLIMPGTSVDDSQRELLSNFFFNCLLDDEAIEKARKAFLSKGFVSYRKKDRAYIDNLLPLIHEDYQTAYARIWYDGHLVLGQRYEVNIENELSDADFVLLVLTKNTVEKGNYVLDVEYPLAKKLGKKIIPILTKEVEVQEVSKVFLDLPKPIDYDDVKAVAEAICSTIPEKKRDNADFITMGSAYAYGTETDVDFRLAAHMFFRALEAGDDIPETISHLHNVMTIAPAKDAVLAASVLVDYFSSKGYDEGDYEKYMDALRIEAECYAVLSDYDKEVESLKRGISLLESLGLVNDTYLSLLARMAELIIEGEGLEEAVEYLKRKAPLKLHDPKHPEPIDPDHEYCYIEGEIHNMATVAHIKAVYALAQLNAGELNRYLLNDVYALLMNLSMGDIINYPSSAYHYAVAFQRFATIISAIGGRKILDGMWDKAYENCAMFYPLDTSLSIDIPKHIYSQTKRIVDPSEENFKGEFDEIVSVMTFVPDGLKLKMAMAFLGLATSANAMGKPYGIYAVIGLTLFKEVVEIDPTVQPYAELLNSMLLANGFPDEDSMGKAAKLYEKATAQFDKKDCKKALENLKSALSILDDYMVLDNFVISLYIKINNLLTKCQYEIDWGRKSKNLWSTRKDLTLSLILLPYVEDKDSDLYLDTCLLAEKVYRQSGEAKRSLQYAYLARISAK